MDKDYLSTVFIDANFENNGIVELKLKPAHSPAVKTKIITTIDTSTCIIIFFILSPIIFYIWFHIIPDIEEDSGQHRLSWPQNEDAGRSTIPLTRQGLLPAPWPQTDPLHSGYLKDVHTLWQNRRRGKAG